jgi:dipeptidyl aminopeptidase/acylaminoacyl peptidase
VYRDFDAVVSAPRITRPVLILHGTADSHPATPASGAQVLFQALTALGTPARLVLLPGEGHNFLTREAVGAAVTEQAVWLRRWTNHSVTPPQAPGVSGQMG